MRKLLVILILVILMQGITAYANDWQKQDIKGLCPITTQTELLADINEAIGILRDMKDIHLTYIAYPQYCNRWTGDVQFHQECVDKYNFCLKVLRDARDYLRR